MLGLLAGGFRGAAPLAPDALQLHLVDGATSQSLHRNGVFGFSRPFRPGQATGLLPLPDRLGRHPELRRKPCQTDELDDRRNGVIVVVRKR